MEKFLKNYFEQRLRDEESIKPGQPRPVVTISREFGCPSKLIGMMLTDALNKRQMELKTRKWRFINKEIVEETAKKLEINPVAMSSLLASGEKGLVEDILKSFSPPYVTSLKIKKSLNEVIRTIAIEGKMIIVGRGSAVILQGHPDTLHIRLQAPVDWRIKEICNSKNLGVKEAGSILAESDKRRTALIEMLLGRKMELNLFDMVFNCSTLGKDEIVQAIIRVLEMRGMV